MFQNDIGVTVDTNVLVKSFLRLLNNEGLINNKTYLAAKEEINKRGGALYVNQEQVQ